MWRWGSVSKQVTVTLAMQLVDAGQLLLDDTLATRGPAFQAPGAAQITVRHLMQHVSGLAQPGDGPMKADGVLSFYRRKGPHWQPDALRFCAGPATAVPGERFLYGDCDTLVLAGLLEHVTGQPVPQPVMATYGAGGAMEGTARDLLAFNRALLAGRVVSAASRQAMWTGEPKWGYAGLGCGPSARRSPAVPSPWNWWSAAAMWVASRRATSSCRSVAYRSWCSATRPTSTSARSGRARASRMTCWLRRCARQRLVRQSRCDDEPGEVGGRLVCAAHVGSTQA